MTKQERLERLRQLRIEGKPGAFSNQFACLQWIDKVAPLLNYDQQLYDNFQENAQHVRTSSSPARLLTHLNAMISIVNQAIAELETHSDSEPVPEPAPKPDLIAKIRSHPIISSIISLYLLIGALGAFLADWKSVLSSQEPTPVPSPSTTQDPVPDVVKRRLKAQADGFTNVDIILWSNSHRNMADLIAHTFEMEGWDVNYNKTAQESHNSKYVTGIEVKGYDSYLVDVAIAAVKALGGWDIIRNVDTLPIPKDNSKYKSVKQRVYIIIGYPVPTPPSSSNSAYRGILVSSTFRLFRALQRYNCRVK